MNIKNIKNKDIRWIQRFNNYKKALAQLQKFVDKKSLSELEEQGLIKSFEYCYELAWNTLKDFLEYRGQTEIFGSRDAIEKAFQLGIITNGELWMDMLKNRKITSHTYNVDTAKEIHEIILSSYYDLFVKFKKELEKFKE